MYPTISHLIEDLFGIYIPLPIQTFGFWVAIAFLAAAYIIQIELRRKEEEGKLSVYIKEKIVGKKLSLIEIIISIATGFLIGFKLVMLILEIGSLLQSILQQLVRSMFQTHS